ncbi:unnamed protein product [Owenia fusiformis]|uniref:Uncharacterized protein n=1 Tax=Owenia fusiformis TaxID=6347 RepID=A0A8J1TNS0_OWEFU|nr:unnamed protein product [Owenia fusiformis]
MVDGDNNTTSTFSATNLTLFGLRKKFPGVENVSTSTLQKWMEPGSEINSEAGIHHKCSNLLILDTRPEEEYKISHLPGALRLQPDATDEQIKSLLEAENAFNNSSNDDVTRIVCYCSVGYRSSAMATKLMALQKNNCPSASSFKTTKIFNLEGSIFKWANEGRAMVDYEQRQTIHAHPYSAIWGKLLNSELRKSSL